MIYLKNIFHDDFFFIAAAINTDWKHAGLKGRVEPYYHNSSFHTNRYYLRELMERAGVLAGIRTLSVVFLSPVPCPVTAPPCFLLPLAGRPRARARGTGGRAKGSRNTRQKGQDSS